MALESGAFVADLNIANPTGTDPKSQGDDHIRLLKTVLRNSFAGFPGAILATGAEAQGGSANDYVVIVSPAPAAYGAGQVVLFKSTHANTGAATLRVNALAAKALKDVDGAALAAGDIASGAVVAALYDGTDFLLVSGNDRAARAGDSYAGAHDFTGATVTAATPAPGDNSSTVATTAFVEGAVAPKAPLASPSLIGTPTAPTAASGTNTTQLATTAFVQQAAFQAALPLQPGGGATHFLSSLGGGASWGLTLATPAEAAGGVINTALMTPLRTKDAIQALSPPISIIVQDQQPNGTNGAAVSEGSWQTCPFNIEVRDPSSLASVGGNQVTLQPGRYEIRVRRSVSYYCQQNNNTAGTRQVASQLRLYNVTAAAVEALGESASSQFDPGSSDAIIFQGTHRLDLVAVVDVLVATTFRVEVFCVSNHGNASYTHGKALSTGGVEVYGTFEAKRTGDA